VFEWLDGELPDAEAAGLQAHVAACEPCRTLVAHDRRFLGVMRRVRGGTDAAPASLRARVQAELARAAQRDGRPPRPLPADVAPPRRR
jgi:anti-sigma factor RsiW